MMGKKQRRKTRLSSKIKKGKDGETGWGERRRRRRKEDNSLAIFETIIIFDTCQTAVNETS